MPATWCVSCRRRCSDCRSAVVPERVPGTTDNARPAPSACVSVSGRYPGRQSRPRRPDPAAEAGIVASLRRYVHDARRVAHSSPQHSPDDRVGMMRSVATHRPGSGEKRRLGSLPVFYVSRGLGYPGISASTRSASSARDSSYAYSVFQYLGDDGLGLGNYNLFDAGGSSLGSRAFSFTVDDGFQDLGSLVADLSGEGWQYLANANLTDQKAPGLALLPWVCAGNTGLPPWLLRTLLPNLTLA